MLHMRRLLALRFTRWVPLHHLGPRLPRQRRQRRTIASQTTTPTLNIKTHRFDLSIPTYSAPARTYLIDCSCCFWRSSSEMAAKAPCVPLMGVVGCDDFFFWSEWSSSMVFAFIGVPLSSWQTSDVASWWVWIFGSPWRPMLPVLVKRNPPFSAPLFWAMFDQVPANNTY